jgi:hypothetical protein
MVFFASSSSDMSANSYQIDTNQGLINTPQVNVFAI